MRQGQARDVARCDQQQHEHAAEQDEERGAEGAVLPVPKGDEAAGPPLMRPRQLSREIRDDGARLSAFACSNVTPSASCAIVTMLVRASSTGGGSGDAERRPDLRREERRREPASASRR